jgi:Fe-S-cluster-containing hydrogenase component 2
MTPSFAAGLMALLDSLEGDTIAVHRERCVPVRNRNARCLRCAEACTSKAIACRDGGFELDPRRCIGCGACATACPTGALEMRAPSDGDLAQQLGEMTAATGGRPVIACRPAVHAATAQADRRRAGIRGGRRRQAGAACGTGRVCELPCLGRLDESLLVGLAAQGAVTVTLVCASCEACRHATGGALMREVVQGARALLAAFGSTMALDVASEIPEQALAASPDAGRTGAFLSAHKGEPPSARGDGLSRRDFLRSLGGAPPPRPAAASGVQAPSETAGLFSRLRAGADGALPQAVPSRRVRLIRSLGRIGEPTVQEVETRSFGSVAIDTQRCDSCRMCAVFCPTGALSKTDEDGRFGLVHRAGACVRCRLCEQVCPRVALTVGARVPVGQLLGTKAVCYRMEVPQWTPNRPDSLFEKMRRAIGPDKEMCMF